MTHEQSKEPMRADYAAFGRQVFEYVTRIVADECCDETCDDIMRIAEGAGLARHDDEKGWWYWGKSK